MCSCPFSRLILLKCAFTGIENRPAVDKATSRSEGTELEKLVRSEYCGGIFGR
jgi:hypothetical protein